MPVDEVEGIYEKYVTLLQQTSYGNKLFTDFHNNRYGENFKYADFAHKFTAENFNPQIGETV